MSFFIIVLIVFSLMYGYVGWRLIVPAAFSLPTNLFLWAALVVLLVLPFVPILARIRGMSGAWLDVAAWIGYLSFGFITLIFAALVVRDLLWLGYEGVMLLSRAVSDSDASNTPDPVRRRLLVNSVNLGLLGLTGAVTGWGMFQAYRKPEIVEVEVPIRNLPEAFDGFRIVQATDIHVSHNIKRGFVQTVVDAVNDLKPDMIALTGDLVDGSVDELREDVEPLATLQAPYGKFFITGNHEYYSGVEQWVEHTGELGFDVLLNEHRVIERDGARFVLAGVTDYSGGQHRKDHATSPQKAAAGAPVDLSKVLLAHQPLSISEAARVGYDYVISGHTHGGQYFPYHFLVSLFQPYVSGMHDHDGTRIYVSKGTGFWGPQLRLGARSEITVHRLTRA